METQTGANGSDRKVSKPAKCLADHKHQKGIEHLKLLIIILLFLKRIKIEGKTQKENNQEKIHNVINKIAETTNKRLK